MSISSSLISLVPLPWRIALCAGGVLLFALSFGCGFWKGYSVGYESGYSGVAILQADYSLRAAEAAQKYAKELEKKTQDALEASDRFQQEKELHENTRADLQRRIDAVTRNSTHNFSAEFVRVFNDAVGAASVGGGAAKNSNTGNPVKGTGSGKATGSGVQGKVNEADVLRWITYYGKRNKDIESQLCALIGIIRERP